MNLQMFNQVLEKAEEPEIKLPTSTGLTKKQEFQKNMKSLSRVQLFATPWTTGSSVHGIFQARLLEWGAIAFSVLVCEMSAIVR